MDVVAIDLFESWCVPHQSRKRLNGVSDRVFASRGRAATQDNRADYQKKNSARVSFLDLIVWAAPSAGAGWRIETRRRVEVTESMADRAAPAAGTSAFALGWLLWPLMACLCLSSDTSKAPRPQLE